MKFKVGDKVRVKKDLEVDKEYGSGYFVDSMEEYKGQIVTVISVETAYYEIEEDDRSFLWTDEMLEPIEKDKNNMNIEKLNEEYKNKMDALMEEYKTKVKEVTKKEEPFVKVGRGYFTINTEFDLDDYCYTESSFDRELLESGNMFPYTKETEDKVRKEVELIAKRRRLQSEMEMFARLNNDCEIDWNNSEQMKWYLYLIYEENEIREGWTWDMRHFNTTYFTSEEIAQKALEKFGDRIRKLYLDVEE